MIPSRMRARLLVLLVSMNIASEVAAQNSGIPPEILAYIETAGVTEDGLPGGKEADAEAFIAYFEKEWESVMALLRTGLEGREQSLIFSAAEFLQPETYASVASEALGLFEDGKVSQGLLENLISGRTRKDGFFYANAEDARIQQILRRATEVLPNGSRVVVEIENALASDISDEISRQRAMNGMPPLESLNQEQSPHNTPNLQNRRGEASGSSDGALADRIHSQGRSGGSESTLVKPLLVIVAIAVLGILLLLLRAFLRGRAS